MEIQSTPGFRVGGKSVLGLNIFDFIIRLKQIFLGPTKFGGHKQFGGHCPRMLPLAADLIQRRRTAKHARF